MPLPSPKGKEKKEKFISRCMGDSIMNKDYPDNKQRAAVCYSQWKKAKKRKRIKSHDDIDPEWDEQSDDRFTFLS